MCLIPSRFNFLLNVVKAVLYGPFFSSLVITLTEKELN